MENTYVPPEVLAQAAANDQKDDQVDDQTASASPTSDSSSSSNDPAGGSNNQASLTNSLSGQDAIGTGEGNSNSQTLTLKEQLRLLSPLGILQALINGEPTTQQQQANQQQEAKLQQHIMFEQQSWQQQQAQAEQRKAALREEIEAIKAQGRGFRHVDSGSVLKQRTTGNPAEVDLQLAQRALQDASRKEAKQRQHGINVPQGTQKGPVDFGTLAKQKSGMQKASEMPMGE